MNCRREATFMGSDTLDSHVSFSNKRQHVYRNVSEVYVCILNAVQEPLIVGFWFHKFYKGPNTPKDRHFVCLLVTQRLRKFQTNQIMDKVPNIAKKKNSQTEKKWHENSIKQRQCFKCYNMFNVSIILLHTLVSVHRGASFWSMVCKKQINVIYLHSNKNAAKIFV